tara:strand:+ start:272 stop:403 length:132 start_codon:yes stop_codon:yes gene_type:complete
MEIHIRGGWVGIHIGGRMMNIVLWGMIIIGIIGWISYFHPLNR